MSTLCQQKLSGGVNMKKAVLLLLVAIIMVLAIGCQKSKSDDISQKYFNKAKNFVKITQEMLNGDIEYEEAKEKLDPITDDFLYDSPEGCDSTTMTLISGSMVTVGTYLEKADNGDEEAIDTVKDNLKDIENEMYK